jgi:hypothetical protein
MRRIRICLMAIILVMVSPLLGQASDSKDHVQDFWLMTQGITEHSKGSGDQPVVIPVTGVVHDVLTVGNDAHIYGQVEDEVVVMHGDAYIYSGGVVKDKVVVIGGRIYMEEGAKVIKGVYSVGGDHTVAASIALAGGVLLLFWIVQLLLTTAVLLVVPAIPFLGHDPIRSMHWRLQERPWQVFMVGFSGIVLFCLFLALMSVSIIGIPFAMIGLVLLLCSFLYGTTALALEVNRWFGNGEWEGENMVENIFRGTLLLAGCGNFPIVGLFVVSGVVIMALGSTLLLVSRKNKED